jgi:hypothetical protein
MKILGTYLCISSSRAPEVIALGAHEFGTFNDRMALASKRESDACRVQAYRLAFGFAFDVAMPCWIDAAMEHIALDYEGAFQAEVRFLAAAIVLGETYGADRNEGKTDGTGGLKVPAVRPKGPMAPKGGASVSDLMAAVSAQS